MSPQKANVAVPTDVQLKAALAATDSVAVTAWNDTAMSATLMEHVPEPAADHLAPGDSRARRHRRAVRERRRSVVQADRLQERPGAVLAGRIGGTSLADPDKYPEAQLATSLVGLSGVGGHSAVELQKLLAGKIAGASPFFTLSTQGISGSSTPANLETGLQLLNLNFTAPGDDPDGVRPDQAPARSGVRQSRQQSERAVR